MILGIDPKVDYAFKLLFGRESSRDLLVHLLNAVLKPGANEQIVSLEILNPFNDKDTEDDKLSVVDVKARDQLARLFNVEMQLFVTLIFRPRSLYYWSRLYQEQMKDGKSYQNLKPTHSICIVNDKMFRNKPGFYTRFHLQSDDGVVFSDHLVVHVIELGKFTKTIDVLADNLDIWCYFLKHAANLDLDQLPEILRIGPFKKAMEILTVITQDDIEREKYEARLKRQLDEASLKIEREELEQELREFAEQIKQHAEQIAKREEQLRQHKEQLRQHKEQLRQNEEQLRQHEEQVRQRDEQVRQRDEQVRQRDEQVRQQAEELRQTLHTLKEALVGKIHLGQRLSKKLLTPREELLTLDVAILEKMSAELEAELQ